MYNLPQNFGQCEKCGCCCRVGFFVEVFNEDDVPENLTEFIKDFGVPIKVMKRIGNTCIAYDEKKKCTIYTKRPTVCREVPAGSNTCGVARSLMRQRQQWQPSP